MRCSRRTIKLLLLIALAWVWPVHAEVMTAHVANVKTSAGSLHGVTLTLSWPKGSAGGLLRLQAKQLDFPTLSFQASKIDWQCPLQRRTHDVWHCAGPVRHPGGTAVQLAIDLSADATDAEIKVGNSRMSYQQLAATPEQSKIRIERIPVQWLKAFLAEFWAEGRWTQGSVSGQMAIRSPERGPFEVRSDLAIAGLGLETPDGLLAAAAVNVAVQLDYRETATTQDADARMTLMGGELLANGLYAILPTSPVQVHVVGHLPEGGVWTLPRLQWFDAGVLRASAQATLDAAFNVSDLMLDLNIDDLAIARDRYLSGFLAPAGFADLVLSGDLLAHVGLQQGLLQEASARLNQVNLIDGNGRFSFAGIGGDLVWTSAPASKDSRLGWEGGAVYGIGLGPASFSLTSANRELRLQQAVSVDALEGKLVLNQLHWQAPKGEDGAKFQFGASVENLDLASLSQRLGWPAFTGIVGGTIPSARYQSNVLTLDGGLSMTLFGGSIALKQMSMERPFGIAPTLSADVVIEDIELEPMTRVFDFGSITGRLDGRIDDLRLVDWSPVAFNAQLKTDRGWKGKRRISQRAVNDISSVGGSGLIAGVQAKVLKLFDDFGYDQIGLGCKLKDNVCRMDGIGSAGNGYIIVAGAGLPRIEVVGFRRRVDWPTLVSRLKAATAGQTPVIQ